ncbi:hypothetical protein GALMADRAFT_220222 [Galerina marginata CBS 339.88]|uniref:F-box domain-containing protein n=1 Tax=Galerina marginata (strain CBS 339.88) TaxID=685588 RepID=A0A067TMX6_GALM3|nr:hypothetical protein GALMADRAFT_220222 [Galerina marginata CBS 339.88]
MPVQSRWVLPQELIDTIIYDLSEDTSTLKACVIVCQNWRPISQSALFRTIRFDQQTMVAYDRSMELLAGTLSENPKLGDLVRAFYVQWAGDHLYKFLKIAAFRSLEQVAMRHMSWVQYTDEGLRCTHKLFQLPSMKTVELFDTTFEEAKDLAKFFEACGPNIKTLRLHRVCFLKRVTGDPSIPYMLHGMDRPKPETEELEFIPENRPKLQTLEIVRGSASYLAEWLFEKKSPFDLSEVEELRFEEDIERNNLDNLAKLLRICSNNLKSLDIYAPREPLNPNNINIRAPTMPNLRNLTISGIGRYAISSAVPWLSQITSDSGIRKLTIKFRFGSALARSVTKPTMNWDDLDNTIDNLPLMSLEDIEVKIPKRDRQTDEDVEKIYRSYLPKVTERSICRLTIL